MKSFDFLDFAKCGKSLAGHYHGQQDPHLEGRIFLVEGNELEIGVSLWEEDIVSYAYDPQQEELNIHYRPYQGIRISVLKFTSMAVPAAIKSVNIYDAQSP